ncbi:MAG TPA: hypothetical protein VD887_12745 [Allosphingosinicella sp.]|nr:hypothetical protein [Allosphingosinicella sp.]
MSAVPRSCASCDETGCAMHRRHGLKAAPAERTCFVVDDAWPEFASFVAASRSAEDRLLAPGLFGPRPARYAWPAPMQHRAAIATARRHLVMRRVARAPGAIRQRAYLDADRDVARTLAKAIDYRARHLVVAQAWLPWLEEAGALGGRSFDVLMSRYPIAEIHRRLDEAAAAAPSATIADFRADPALAAREADLLARARRIVTPHAGIAALFPDQAVKLAWHRPQPRPRRGGDRVAFLGPTIMRQRPDVARAHAAALDRPLLLFGELLEGSDFWDGIAIERRTMGRGWLDDIGAILHPATMTVEPRRLLEALAAGVTIYATPGCGLDPADYLPLEAFAAAPDERRRAAA